MPQPAFSAPSLNPSSEDTGFTEYLNRHGNLLGGALHPATNTFFGGQFKGKTPGQAREILLGMYRGGQTPGAGRGPGGGLTTGRVQGGGGLTPQRTWDSWFGGGGIQGSRHNIASVEAAAKNGTAFSPSRTVLDRFTGVSPSTKPRSPLPTTDDLRVAVPLDQQIANIGKPSGSPPPSGARTVSAAALAGMGYNPNRTPGLLPGQEDPVRRLTPTTVSASDLAAKGYDANRTPGLNPSEPDPAEKMKRVASKP